jgi:Cu/Ag efflux protein CusF
MRLPAYLMLATAPLALAACSGKGQEKADESGTAMTSSAPTTSATPMANMPMPASSGAATTATGEGTVTAIDETGGTVTIDHGAIPAVGWPSMTMTFTADKSLRQKVAKGDRVRFEFRTTESGGELTAINKK